MFALHLYERPAAGSTFRQDITRHGRATWNRTTRALGGFWTGEFTITDTMPRVEMWNFYHSNIGRLIKEISFGRVTWEGEIYEMTLTMDGATERMTLDPDTWHNKVKVQYTYPTVLDTNQGVLTYDPDGGNSLQDTLQDFGDWETLWGNANYHILVTNTDTTSCSGYMGGAFDTGAVDDSIHVFRDLARDNSGWNGDETGKIASSYVVSSVAYSGVSLETAWNETTESSELYGECEFVDVRGEMETVAAEGIRDRRLTEHAYPRSVPSGGLSSDETSGVQEASLTVMVAGYAYSMNRRHMESDIIAAPASTQIGVLVDGSADAAEFVTAGRIDTNAGVSPSIMCQQMSMRLWDLAEEITEQGNGTGARWVSGVYEGRKLNYEAAETTAYYYWRHGRLVNHAGQPVMPTFIRPNIIVERDAPFGVTAISGNDWDNPRQFYVEEVEFVAPNRYRLIPFEGEALIGAY